MRRKYTITSSLPLNWRLGGVVTTSGSRIRVRGRVGSGNHMFHARLICLICPHIAEVRRKGQVNLGNMSCEKTTSRTRAGTDASLVSGAGGNMKPTGRVEKSKKKSQLKLRGGSS